MKRHRCVAEYVICRIVSYFDKADKQLRLHCARRLQSYGGSVFTGGRTSLCRFIRTISQNSLQLASPNVTQKCTTMSLRNPFILGSKDQR